MKKNLLFYFALLLLTACKMDNVINLEVSTEGKVSNIADSISYINLETSNECFLGNIIKMIINDNVIYVLDNQASIYMFDINGNYIKKLNRYGKGPGEYIQLNSFFVDNKHNIHIMDLLLKKIFIYNKDLEFISETNIDDYPRDFLFNDGDYLLYMPDKNMDARRGLYSLSNNEYKRLYKIKESVKNVPSSDNNIINIDNKGLFGVINKFNNEIVYVKNNTIINSVQFNIEPLAKEFNAKNESSKYAMLFYTEASSMILMLFGKLDPQTVKLFLYNKNDNSYQVYNNLINDIDDINIGNPINVTMNNSFIFIIPGGLDENGHENNPILQLLHLKNHSQF